MIWFCRVSTRNDGIRVRPTLKISLITYRITTVLYMRMWNRRRNVGRTHKNTLSVTLLSQYRNRSYPQSWGSWLVDRYLRLATRRTVDWWTPTSTTLRLPRWSERAVGSKQRGKLWTQSGKWLKSRIYVRINQCRKCNRFNYKTPHLSVYLLPYSMLQHSNMVPYIKHSILPNTNEWISRLNHSKDQYFLPTKTTKASVTKTN